MTQTIPEAEAFADWYYIRDPTHVAFYCQATFEWIAQHDNLTILMNTRDVVLFRKTA